MSTLQISTINDADILRVINSGGFSDVFLALHPEYGEVAIKLHKAGWEMRAQQETEIMRSLSHSGVVRVYGGGKDQGTGRLYTVMEYVPFPTLETLIKQHKIGGSEQVVAVLKKVARILDYVYHHSPVQAHRDIKPANIFVDMQGRRVGQVKIADFGIVRIDGGNRTCGAFGDPDYIAPEQIENKPHLYGPGTDMYSMGCLAYAMLTGRAPFRNKGGIDRKLTAHCRETPPPLTAYGKEFDAVIHKCMAKDPRMRYRNMGELTLALEKIKGTGVPGTGRSTASIPMECSQTVTTGNSSSGMMSPSCLLGCAGVSMAMFMLLLAVVGVIFGMMNESMVLYVIAALLGGMGMLLFFGGAIGLLIHLLKQNVNTQ